MVSPNEIIIFILIIIEKLLQNTYFRLIDYAKAFMQIPTNWEILKEMEYQTTWSVSWEIRVQVRKQQLELDTEQ